MNEKLLGLNPHFGGVLLPKKYQSSNFVQSPRVVDHKNTSAYQIWRWRHQVNWGPNLHFGRVLHPKSSTHQMLSKVSQRAVDNKNTAAYEIWWLGYQETWGPNHHFKGVLHHAL